MTIRFEERNGRTYAYRCRSKRVDGVNHPVTTREYLGTVDPKNGMICPPKIHPEDLVEDIRNGEFRSLDYGPLVLLNSVCEQIPYLNNFQNILEDDYRVLLLIAMIRVIKNPEMNLFDAAYNMYLKPFIGKNSVTKSDIKHLEQTIRKHEQNFLDLLETVVPGYLYIQYIPPKKTSENEHTSDCKNLDSKRPYLLIFTDKDGIPQVMKLMIESHDVLKVMRKFYKMFHIPDNSINVIECDGSIETILPRTVMDNHGFIIHADALDPFLSKIIQVLITKMDMEGDIYEYMGRQLRVLSTPIGLKHHTDNWTLITDNLENSTFICKAIICLDENESKRIHSFIDNYNRHESTFNQVLTNNNIMTQKDAVTHYNLAGVYIFLTDSANWNDCMETITIKNNFHDKLSPLRGVLNEVSKKHSDRIHPEVLSRFLSIRIKYEFENILKSKGIDMDIYEALELSSSFRVVTFGKRILYSEVEPRLVSLFSTIGVKLDQ